MCREFDLQSKKEAELGLPVTPFMSGLDDELKIQQLQFGFVSNIVLPLWASVAACFPNTQPALDQLRLGEKMYSDRAKELVAVATAAAI